jgi:hypothetical protein
LANRISDSKPVGEIYQVLFDERSDEYSQFMVQKPLITGLGP